MRRIEVTSNDKATGDRASVPPSPHACETLFKEILEDPALTDIERMVKRYEREAKSYRGSGVYEMCLGSLWLQGQRYDEARAIWQAGLATDNPYHRKLRYALVSIDIEQKRFDQAKTGAQRLTQTDPDWSGGHRLLMLVAMGEERWAEAASHGEAAIKRERHPAVYLGLTMVYHRLGMHREAVAVLREALLIDSSLVAQPSGITQGIHSFIHLGMYADARHLIDARKRLDPRWTADEALQQAIAFLQSSDEANMKH